jgi:hypothetical protein
MGGSDEKKIRSSHAKPIELFRRPILNHLKRGELLRAIPGQRHDVGRRRTHGGRLLRRAWLSCRTTFASAGSLRQLIWDPVRCVPGAKSPSPLQDSGFRALALNLLRVKPVNHGVAGIHVLEVWLLRLGFEPTTLRLKPNGL